MNEAETKTGETERVGGTCEGFSFVCLGTDHERVMGVLKKAFFYSAIEYGFKN